MWRGRSHKCPCGQKYPKLYLFVDFRALYSALLYTYTEVYDNSLFPDYFPTFFVTIPTTFYIYPTKSNIRKRHRCESISLLVPVRSRKMFIFSFCFCWKILHVIFFFGFRMWFYSETKKLSYDFYKKYIYLDLERGTSI